MGWDVQWKAAPVRHNPARDVSRLCVRDEKVRPQKQFPSAFRRLQMQG